MFLHVTGLAAGVKAVIVLSCATEVDQIRPGEALKKRLSLCTSKPTLVQLIFGEPTAKRSAACFWPKAPPVGSSVLHRITSISPVTATTTA